MRNLFLAYAAVWLIHLGYLFRLSSGQRKLSDELAMLKKSVGVQEPDMPAGPILRRDALMEKVAKNLSRVIFGIAFFCFFLPFLNVSCGGQKVATFTGIQLVTGTTIEQPSILGERKTAQRVSAEPLAIFGFLCAIVGFSVSFLKGRKSPVALAITGAAGSILLLLLKAKIDNDVLREGRGILQLSYDMGFWLAFFLFLSVAALNAFLFFSAGQRRFGDDKPAPGAA